MTTATNYATLVDRVKQAQKAYYADDAPIMSDAEYDTMFRTLQDAAKADPSLAAKADHVLHSVGGGLVDTATFSAVTHTVPMLSLDNIFALDALDGWAKGLDARVGGNASWSVQVKGDGISLSMTFEDGVLVQAASRGSGEVGESLLANARTIADVPDRLTTDAPHRVEVRGEVMMTFADFTALNERRAADGQDLYKNPRNTAGGALRQKDPAETAKRPLTLRVFDVAAWDDDNLPMPEGQALADWFAANGLPLMDRSRFGLTTAEVVDAVAALENAREGGDLPFPADGTVVKIDNTAQRNKVGSTSRVPVWGVAVKTLIESVRSTVVAIDGIVGRTGKWVPRAQIVSVDLSGVTITYASLGSVAVATSKDVRIGDTVEIVRRGDVIPYVQQVIVEDRDGTQQPWSMPDLCSQCDGPLVMDGPHGYCNNDTCEGRAREAVSHVVSRDRGFDLDGVGSKIADALFDEGALTRDDQTTWANLFLLTESEWAALAPVAEANAPKIAAECRRAIAESDPVRVLTCLFATVVGGGFGRSLSKSLIKAYGSVHAVLDAATQGPSVFINLDLFGSTRAEAVATVLTNTTTAHTVAVLADAGFDLDRTPAGWGDMSSLPHDGKTFVLTGALTIGGEKTSRVVIKDALEALGAKVSGSVSSTTSALISDDGSATSSKGKKATSLGVSCLNDEQLQILLAGTPMESL